MNAVAPGSRAERRFDVICVGRAAVDLYGEQVGSRLEDVQTFAKYLGGSPANTAVGGARLGLRPAMLTRVGDEHNGRFVRETLAAEGVDVAHVKTDPARLTALVFLSLRDRETFPLLFYRDNCADMALHEGDVDEAFIATATGLLISGTHLSRPGTYAACLKAMRAARAAGTRVVLDIDYRPVLWGLTGLGLGEQRYVGSQAVSERLQTVIGLCDLVVGTDEEIHIAGGSTDTLAALRRLRELSEATIVLKRGAAGCVVFDGVIPGRLEDGLHGAGFPIEVFNVLGAGDAFMAGFLRGWLRNEPLATCCTWGNACGALVVSRHGCAPAMPSWAEMQDYVQRGSPTRRLREDARLEHIHRASTRRKAWPELLVLAFDHRTQFEDLAAQHRRDAEAIRRFKQLVARAAALGANGRAGAGVIVDTRYGEDLLPPFTGTGWWVARPVERPGSRPLAFEPATSLALELRGWPGEQVVKCLVSHHPEDPPSLRGEQLARLCELQEASVGTGHELLVEVVPPRDSTVGESTLADAMAQIYDAGVRPDWWKLPPSHSDTAWRHIGDVIERHDPFCRGVLILGMSASGDELERGFRAAAPHAVCKGFAVGRAIFGEAAGRWFAGEIDDEEAVRDIASRYGHLIARWDAARAAITHGDKP